MRCVFFNEHSTLTVRNGSPALALYIWSGVHRLAVLGDIFPTCLPLYIILPVLGTLFSRLRVTGAMIKWDCVPIYNPWEWYGNKQEKQICVGSFDYDDSKLSHPGETIAFILYINSFNYLFKPNRLFIFII